MFVDKVNQMRRLKTSFYDETINPRTEDIFIRNTSEIIKR